MVHECIAVSGHLRFGRMARIFDMLLSNMGMEGIPSKNQHRKLIMVKKGIV